MPPRELREILRHVGVGRRAFLRQVMKGTAFATPVVASFGMGALPAAADHVERGYICHTAGVSGPSAPPVPISVPATLPSGTPACCQLALDTMRAILIMMGETELEADDPPLAAASRARLMERLTTALTLGSEGIAASGPQCAPNRRYARAAAAMSDYKGLAAQAALPQYLSDSADAMIGQLTQLANAAC
jgi:hypothetical protein